MRRTIPLWLAPALAIVTMPSIALGAAPPAFPETPPPAVDMRAYEGAGPLGGSAPLPPSGILTEPTDLNVTLIERTPRYDFDAVKNNPNVGDVVTFRGHIKNWGSSAVPSVPYRWQIDGITVASGTLGMAPGEEHIVTHSWIWQSGVHLVKLTADVDGVIDELSETNNEVEERTNAITAGFWVEQSAYNYFHQFQKDLGVGSNSWEDWIRRQMDRQNELYADAIWPISPQGVLDRVRIDKIVVVPDGALPLSGGLPTNHPDVSDKTVDLMWGFPANQIPPSSTSYADHTTVSENNPFYIERSLIHELGHARYLIDCYGFDVHNTASHGGYDAVQIWEGTTYVGGSSYMPFIAFGEVLYYNRSGGVMTGPYDFQWSPYEAGALNRIAGQRATCGNYNAPCNIGAFLQDLPQNNHVRFVDTQNQPLVTANVRVYRAVGASGIWYGKTFDNTYDAEYTTDTGGYVHLPRNPFTSGGPIEHTFGISNGVLIFRIQHFGQIWYRFFEVSDVNMQYWLGNTQDAYYSIVLEGADLHLRFNGNAMGTLGEAPTVATGVTYEGGAFGSGIYLGEGNELRYPIAGNIDTGQGTLRFWIKPRWNGSDNQDHYAVRVGGAGGILIGKDAANFWRIILNRFGGAGGPEIGTGVFINDWRADWWHHVAFTWSPSLIQVYIDGQVRATAVPSNPPPMIPGADLQIGADGPGGYLDALVDELEISDRVWTHTEIVTAVESGPPDPSRSRFRLGNAVPNPASHGTSLSLDLPRAGNVQIDVFDIHGRRVTRLVSGSMPAGNRTVRWDGTAQGERAGSGIYWIVATHDGTSVSRRVVLMR